MNQRIKMFGKQIEKLESEKEQYVEINKPKEAALEGKRRQLESINSRLENPLG